MRDVQALFVVCMAFSIGVHCTILKNTATNENENKTRAVATCKVECANNGVCDGEGDAKFCSCKPGTSGDLCEKVHACKEMMCGYGKNVKCVYDDSTGGGKCVCENSTKSFDYEELKCRVPCDDNCHNGMKCEYVRDIRFCSCNHLLSGDFCETVEECTRMRLCGTSENVKCVYDETQERAVCKCDDPSKSFDLYYDECRTPCITNDDCESFEKCTESLTGKYFCHCLPGKSGKHCENINDCIYGKYTSCKNDNGQCVYSNENERAECDCGDGKIWDDRRDQNRCRTTCKVECANNGVCDGEGDAKFCRCKPGTSGDLCEKVDACEEMMCGYEKDVKCVYDENTGGGKCVCENSTTSFDYDFRKCRVPCNDDCHNGMKCEYVRDIRFCFCNQWTSGDFCETVKECTIKSFCGIRKDVQCVYNETEGRATCKCDDPKKSFYYRSRDCRTLCSTNDDCRSFETCTETFTGVRFCSCLPGRSGENCEDIDDCIDGKYKSCKRNNGRCFYSIENERAECDCGDGKIWDDRWKQERCRRPCKDDCAHNGVCEGDGDVKFCTCSPAFDGDLCEKLKDCSKEKDLCGSGNDVKCVFDERINITKCVCDNSSKLFDYDEKRCRVPCKDDCFNNGKCEYVEARRDCRGECEYYRKFCFCKQGTSGNLCEIVDDCTEKNFCGMNADVKCVYDETKHKATCKCDDPKKSFDSYAKMCKPFCRTNTDCRSTEKCAQVEDAQGICLCKAGRSGDKCQFVDDCMTGRYSDCNGGKGRCSYNHVKETAECDCGVGKRWDESRTMCRYTCKDNCVNNGACEGVDDAKFCRCNAGTSGDYCEVVHDCNWAEICGKSTDVKCVYDESTGGGNCLCNNNTKFFDYHKKECRVPCKDDCANQGECVVAGEYKFCKCRPGTSGDLCTITKDCDKQDFCGTKTDVKCVYDEISETSYCKCNEPMKRFDPITHECIRDMCTNNTCQTGGITAGRDGDEAKFYCGVPFSGQRCEEGGVCFCLRHCS